MTGCFASSSASVECVGTPGGRRGIRQNADGQRGAPHVSSLSFTVYIVNRMRVSKRVWRTKLSSSCHPRLQNAEEDPGAYQLLTVRYQPELTHITTHRDREHARNTLSARGARCTGDSTGWREGADERQAEARETATRFENPSTFLVMTRMMGRLNSVDMDACASVLMDVRALHSR